MYKIIHTNNEYLSVCIYYIYVYIIYNIQIINTKPFDNNFSNKLHFLSQLKIQLGSLKIPDLEAMSPPHSQLSCCRAYSRSKTQLVIII